MDMSNMMMNTSMMEGMDMMAMQNLVEACSACEQARTMCAMSCVSVGERDKCVAMDMSCAEMCNTMMRMMLRSSMMDMDAMMAMLQACMTMGRACAAECGNHADMSEQCRMCAMACTEMADACEAMMASMKAMR